jgi:hypothetical protein
MDPEIQKLMMAEALRREQQRRAGEAQSNKEAAEKKVEYGTGLARAVGQGLSFGFGDEIEAYLRKGDGTYEEKLAEIRSAMGQFAEQNPNTALGAEIVGSLPTALLGGAGLARVGVTGAAKIAGTQGAVYGFGAGEGGATERAKSAVLGGAVGAGVGKASDVIFPKVTEAAKAMMKEGVRLTPAQRVGGMTRAVEEKLKSMPIVGDIISNAEARALRDFNTGAMNNVMSMLGKGKKIPKGTAGNEAFQIVDEAINDAYNTVIPKLSVELDNKFQSELVKILRNNRGLGTQGLDQFNKQLQVIFSPDKVGKGNIVAGQTLRNMDSELGEIAMNFLRSNTATERQMGKAIFDVQKLLRDSMKSKDRAVMAEYTKTQAAFRQFLPVRSAVVKANRQEGVFTPNQLLKGSEKADRSAGKRVTARGEAPQQRYGQQGAEALASNVPNSGTVDRAALALLGKQFLDKPFQTVGVGIPATLGTGAIYNTALGRGLTSGLLQTPRAVGTTVAPAAGGILAGPTIENARRLFGSE